MGTHHPVEFVFGWQFHRNAAVRLRAWSANMDTLVSMGTLAAYGWSVYAFFADEHVFFETAAVIVTFLLLGRYFGGEAKSCLEVPSPVFSRWVPAKLQGAPRWRRDDGAGRSDPGAVTAW